MASDYKSMSFQQLSIHKEELMDVYISKFLNNPDKIDFSDRHKHMSELIAVELELEKRTPYNYKYKAI